MTNSIPEVAVGGRPGQCFPFYVYDEDGTNRRENVTDWALDWVIDQYRIKTDKRSGITSGPNRPDDPEYIVRLVGQVVEVGLQTVRIVAGLPADFGAKSS